MSANPTSQHDIEKAVDVGAQDHPDVTHPEMEKDVTIDAQRGVQDIEAAAGIWTKWHLIAAYTLYVQAISSILPLL